MKLGATIWAGVLCLLLSAGSAQAQTCTTSATTTNFGGYNPTDLLALDGSGNVQVSCTGLISLLVSYTIQLSSGASGSFATRTLSNGTHALGYNLYTNVARITVWGDGSGSTFTVTDGYLIAIAPTVRNYPVYGRIAAGQNVPPGAYSDTITVTVNY